MTILALDLGTTTGWCIGSESVSASGTWHLKPSRYDGGGMRFIKLRARLREVFNVHSFDAVYFEEVRNHKGVDAAQVYGGLMATLQAWCEENMVPYEGIPVGAIKKFWTGKGNSNKAAMIAEAVRREFAPVDDNEADALAIFHLVLDRGDA